MLGTAKKVGQFEYKRDGNNFSMKTIRRGITIVEAEAEILSILKHECIEYENIDIRRSNLEEIFLKITGSKLLENGE